jgi:hypothetical protein
MLYSEPRTRGPKATTFGAMCFAAQANPILTSTSGSGYDPRGGFMNPVTLDERSQALECAVHAISDWDGFEKLIQFLGKYYDGRVLERTDGPDSRIAMLEVRGLPLEVQYEDPWGNSILSRSSQSHQLLREITADLLTRLSGADEE